MSRYGGHLGGTSTKRNRISFFCFPPTWPPKPLFSDSQGIDCKPPIVADVLVCSRNLGSR